MPGNRVRVSFADVQDYEVLPAGTYTVQVEDVEERESNSSEYPYLNWTFVVTEGEAKNRKFWSITSLSPKAAFKLRETLVGFGEDPEALKADFDFDPSDYIGTHCKVVVGQETYNGSLRNRVEKVEPLEKRSTSAGAAPAGGRRVIR